MRKKCTQKETRSEDVIDGECENVESRAETSFRERHTERERERERDLSRGRKRKNMYERLMRKSVLPRERERDRWIETSDVVEFRT